MSFYSDVGLLDSSNGLFLCGFTRLSLGDHVLGVFDGLGSFCFSCTNVSTLASGFVCLYSFFGLCDMFDKRFGMSIYLLSLVSKFQSLCAGSLLFSGGFLDNLLSFVSFLSDFV
jgi:hypothetical protein